MTQHNYYLQQMGITPWQERTESTQEVENRAWEQLKKEMQSCPQCEHDKTRKNITFGIGDIHADLVIIIDASDAEPFVSRAGQLLNEMLSAIGLDTERVFIIPKILICPVHLEQQLAIINPKVILVTGEVSAQHLLDVQDPLDKLRGKQWPLTPLSLPLIVTYHPTYLLQNPKDKKHAYLDLLNIYKILIDY